MCFDCGWIVVALASFEWWASFIGQNAKTVQTSDLGPQTSNLRHARSIQCLRPRSASMSRFFRYELLVVGGGKQRVEFTGILQRHLQHPGAVRIRIYLFGRSCQVSIDLSYRS